MDLKEKGKLLYFFPDLELSYEKKTSIIKFKILIII